MNSEDYMQYPLLKGKTIFRKDMQVYVNRSDELKEFCGIIHRHDFIEISYVIEGKGIHRVGDKNYNISKGDLFIINYDVPHGFFSISPESKEPVVYNCVFLPQFIDATLFSNIHFEDISSSFLFKSLFPEDHQLDADLNLSGAQFSDIGEIFSRMYKEYNQMQAGYSDIIRAYIIELIVKIMRYDQSQKHISTSPRNKQLIENALDYMRSNFNSELKLEDLAMKCFISRNYFSKVFKETTGMNFSDYIQRLRVEEACNLLKTSDMKVIDIACQVGFKDMKFFYEVFKKITGHTPGDFRKL